MISTIFLVFYLSNCVHAQHISSYSWDPNWPIAKLCSAALVAAKLYCDTNNKCLAINYRKAAVEEILRKCKNVTVLS